MEVELPDPPKIEGVEIRHCPGHPGYAIGDDGTPWTCWKIWGYGQGFGTTSIISSEWKRLRPGMDGRTGHLSVSLKGKNYKVHRLVLEAFVGPCPEGMEACHDPDPTPANCTLTNLRWDTHANNMEDARRHGRLAIGERSGPTKLTECAVREIRLLFGVMPQPEIAKLFGITQQTVSDIKRGKSWSWLK